jgi:glycosyltransferase involved in cell wall biosynthesis
MQRAGLRVTVLTDDRPDPGAVRALAHRRLVSQVAADREPAITRRVQQHLLRLPGPRSSSLVSRAAEIAAQGGLVQLEGVIAASHLAFRTSGPVIFSTHNVEGKLACGAAGAVPRFTVEGLRRRYHAHRVDRTERRTARVADAVICVSHADADAFAPRARRVVIAPNGVDEEFFAVPGADPHSEDVLFFGQFSYAPNLEGMNRFLAEGWPVLARSRPRSRLLVAGERSRELFDRDLAADSRVVVLGLVEDLAATMARARLTVVPIWRGGGTRLKALEALAAGRPVVGTPLGVSGIGFEPGRHGVVVESPVELGRAAAELLGRPEVVDAMAARGRRLAAGYRWDRALTPAEELYREFAASGSSRA